MIRAECFVFAAMFVTGAIAGAVASFLLLLGKGSRLARAIFDLLAPASVGAFFFFGMQYFAEGVFRVYALFAFAAGIFCAQRLLRKISPAAKRFLRKVFLPIKSLAYALEDKVDARLEPLRAKRRAAKVLRAKAREEKRIERRSRRQEERMRKRAVHAPLHPKSEMQEGAYSPVVLDRRGEKGERNRRARKRRAGKGSPALGGQSD